MKTGRIETPIAYITILLCSIVTFAFPDFVLKNSDNSFVLKMNDRGDCLFPSGCSEQQGSTPDSGELKFYKGSNNTMWTSGGTGSRQINLSDTLGRTIPSLSGHLVIKNSSGVAVGALSTGPLPSDCNLYIKGDLNTHAYYVDVDKIGGSNSGTFSDPWTSADKVNEYARGYPYPGFVAGDAILFKRGTVITRPTMTLSLSTDEETSYDGVICVKNCSGTATMPIVIDAYGEGPKPIICDSAGIPGTAAIYLNECNYWTIQNMEFRNDVPAHYPTAQASRWGILIRNLGGSYKVHILNNIFRNVFDSYCAGSYALGIPGLWYSIPASETPAGIFLVAFGSGDDNLIEGNEITDMWGEGIRIVGDLGANNYTIRNNSIRRTNGNSITTLNTNNPTIEKNICDSAGHLGVGGVGSQLITGVYGRDATPSGGIMVEGCNGSLIQNNEISHIKMWGGDAMAVDIDGNMTGQSIVQYNYSHENGGPFLSEGGNDFGYLGTTVRYNISLNDGNPSYWSKANIANHVESTLLSSKEEGTLNVYNNVFYKTAGSGIIYLMDSNIKSPNFFNNNIYWCTTYTPYQINSYYHCLYENESGNNPRFINAGAGGDGFAAAQYYKLQPGSPWPYTSTTCINMGTNISPNPGYDFWDNTLYTGTADIGAHEVVSGTNFSLVVSDGGSDNGDVLPAVSYPGVPVRSGETVPIKAIPINGYRLLNWEVTSASGTATIADTRSPSTVVTVSGTGDAAVKANFTAKTYPLFIQVDNSSHGSLSLTLQVDTMTLWGDSKEQVAIAAFPNLASFPTSSYKFDHWGVSGSAKIYGPNSPSTFIVPTEAATVTAYFTELIPSGTNQNLFKVTVTDKYPLNGYGTVWPSPGEQVSYGCTGDRVLIMAKPNGSHTVQSWTVTPSSTPVVTQTDKKYGFVVIGTADIEVEVTFN